MNGNTTKNPPRTCANTNLVDWKNLVLQEYAKRNMQPIEIPALRMLHSWEGGDTPYAHVDFTIRNKILRERTIQVKRDNPRD